VALSLNISRSTVTNYQQRPERRWSKNCFRLVCVEAPAKALPDFDYIYRELTTHKKSDLTLDQLWREYWNSTQTATNTRSSASSIVVTETSSMRQDHKGGEKLFVD
jgi:hypothetical protein